MEQPIKVILSSDALYKTLNKIDLEHWLQDSIVRIRVSNGKLQIESVTLDVEHSGNGWIDIRVERVIYLRRILSRIEDSPVVLIIGGDNLFLSEIYI